jgi:hypothetical protein
MVMSDPRSEDAPLGWAFHLILLLFTLMFGMIVGVFILS